MPGANIPELWLGQKWNADEITFSFLTSFPNYYNQTQQNTVGIPGPNGPEVGQLSEAQKAIVRDILAQITSFTGLTFAEVEQDNSNNQVGEITFGRGTVVGNGVELRYYGDSALN